MQEQDEVPDDLIHQMQAERRLTKGFNDSRLRERVEVLGLTLTLDKPLRAIANRSLDRLSRPWDEMLQLLVVYKKQHRQPRVRKSASSPWTELLSANVPVLPVRPPSVTVASRHNRYDGRDQSRADEEKVVKKRW